MTPDCKCEATPSVAWWDFPTRSWVEIHTSSKNHIIAILSTDAYFQNSWMCANFRGVLIFLLVVNRHMTFTFPVIYLMPSGSFTADFCSMFLQVSIIAQLQGLYAR